MLGLVGSQLVGSLPTAPVYHQLGQQSWRTPGEKTFEERASCLAKGGQFSVRDVAVSNQNTSRCWRPRGMDQTRAMGTA